MEPIERQHLTIPSGSLERLITTVPLEALLALEETFPGALTLVGGLLIPKG